MPTLETPPNIAPSTGVPPPPKPERSPGKVRAGRFGELDHTELVNLLDSLDDERAKARFRESIYISLFFWIAVVAFLIFAPRWLPHSPEFVLPSGLKTEKEMTSLSIPAEVQKAINHAPKVKSAPRAQTDSKLLDQMRQQQNLPQAPAPQQAEPQPRQVPRQSPEPAAPPPVVQQSTVQQPRPPQNAAPLPSAPAPSTTPTRPNFGNPNTSAHDMVQQAGRAPRGTGGLIVGGDPNGPVRQRGLAAGGEILSDTQGVDFNAYLAQILKEIDETWQPLVPEEARPPLNKQGEAQIRFTILPNGDIGGMTLEWSTHDDAINRSCWGSIIGVGQFPPLPRQFHGPNIELRVHYLVNKKLE